MGLLLNTRKLVKFVYDNNPQVPGMQDLFSGTDISRKDAKQAIVTALNMNLIEEIDSTKGVTTNDYGVTYPKGKYFIRGPKWFPYGVMNEWVNQHNFAAQIITPLIVTISLFVLKWGITGQP